MVRDQDRDRKKLVSRPKSALRSTALVANDTESNGLNRIFANNENYVQSFRASLYDFK